MLEVLLGEQQDHQMMIMMMMSPFYSEASEVFQDVIVESLLIDA
jgi:hypothetical protein